jgi:dipeptidyl aminopeptidase/acylaminoacyl peptidase
MLFPVGGGAPRRLPISQSRGQVYGLAWRSPGELLYAEVSGPTASGSSRVLAHDVEGGATRALFSLPGRIVVVDAAGARVAVDVVSTRQTLQELSLAGAAAAPATTAPRESPSPRPVRTLTRAGAEDRQPVYSPDGRYLVFSSNRTGNLDLWRLTLADGEERQLTDDPADDWDPSFTPDGSGLLWSSNRGGHFEIWEMAVDGSGARQVTNDGADAENPTASPDGWVVYNSFHPDKAGVWKVRRDGTGAARVVAGATTLPELSPDGRLVLYVADYVGRQQGMLRAVRLADGVEVFATPFPYARLNDGRARWLRGGGAFAFVADDPRGRGTVYLQPFAPGRDTLAERRPLLAFDLGAAVETFAFAPDGDRVTVSTLEQESFLLLADPP